MIEEGSSENMTNPSRENFLRSKFVFLQREMNAAFEQNRAEFQHRGNRGTGAEIILKNFLKRYLPPKYALGNGEVIDSYGSSTGQLDVIVVNEHHPFINNFDQPSVYFSEGVGCVGEVKSLLNGDELNSVMLSCQRVKSCRREIHDATAMNANISDANRYTLRIPYFLFCFSSDLALLTIYERLQDFKTKNSPEDCIDAVFVLNRGSIVDFGDGRGSFQFILAADGAPVMGYFPLHASEEGVVLMDAMRFLHSCLIEIPRAAPILGWYMN